MTSGVRMAGVRGAFSRAVLAMLLALSVLVVVPGAAGGAGTVRLAFAVATQTVPEDNASVTVDVVATADEGGTLGSNIDVDVAVLGASTATDPGDFTYSGETLSWLSTDTSPATRTITITLNGDSLVEGRETIRLGLSGPTGGAVLGNQTTSEVRLNDNDGFVVSFGRIDSTSAESGSPSINVQLDTGGSTLTEALDVTISAPGGTATGGGDDYTISPTTVTFPVGSGDNTAAPVPITITDDADHEPDETVVLSISPAVTADAVATGMQSTHTLTITDNDDVTASFTSGSSNPGEGVGTHTVVVNLSWTGGAALRDPVVLDLSATPGTATTPADFALTTTQVTFPAGASSGATRNVNVTIVDDDVDEGNQSFSLGLVVNSGPATGGTTSHTVTIVDNDAAGVSIGNPGGLSVSEATPGTADAFTVVLDTEPTAPVDVDVDVVNGADGEIQVEGGTTTTLTFTSGNWDTPQPVDVTAIDDGYFEGAHTGSISFTVSSTDLVYDGFSVPNLTANVTDDDVLVISGPTTGNEGQVRTYSATGFDPPGAGNSHSYAWSVTKDGASYGAGTGATLDVTPNDNASYVVSLTITDGDAGETTDTETLTVSNVAPVAVAGTVAAVDEGGTATLSGFTYSDAGTADTHTATVNWGDGTTDNCPAVCTVGGGVVTGSHVYADDDADDTYTVTVTVTDDDGGVSSPAATTTVTVSNLDPIVTVPTTVTLDEGDVLGSTITFTDAGVLDTHTAEVDYDEGVGTESLGAVSSGFALDNLYEEDGTYSVVVTVSDDDGGSDGGTIALTVDNAVPVVTARSDITINDGDTVFINGGGGTSFTDAGTLDTHTATIDWGDGGGPETATVNQGAGSGTVGFPGGHMYTAPGTYTVTVVVTDDDGGIGQDTFTVQVDNADFDVTATPTPGLPVTIDEGDPVSLAVTFTDLDGMGTHTALIQWAVGVVDDCSTAACTIVDNGDGTGTVTGSHVYPQDGSFNLVVTVSDETGDVGTDGFTVTVDNVLPTSNVDGPATSLEGERIQLVGNPSDPGAEDALTYAWEIRDGTGAVMKTGTNRNIFVRPTDNGSFEATYTVFDDDGDSGGETFAWTVDNVAPTAVIIDADTGDPVTGITEIGVEGSTITLGATVDDPGADDTFTYDWEIVQPGSTPITGTEPTISFVSPDDGLFFVNLTVTDDDGGSFSPTAPIIDVTNGDPEILDIVTDATPAVGLNVALNLFFTDPGSLDTHSATIDWGDGNTTTIGAATSPVAVSHSFPTAGARKAKACVTDDNGGRTCASWFYNVGASLQRNADFDGDGYDDLAVGVPGEDDGAGGVHVVYGSRSGPSDAGDRFFQQGGGLPDAKEAGDGFGATLAHGDFNGDGYTDLAVGAPGDDMAGRADVGNVTVIYGSASGLDPATAELWHQNRKGVLDKNEAGDGWGQALVTGDFNGDAFADLAVGAPFENVGGVADAGRVTILFGRPGGLTAAGDVVLDQDVDQMRNNGQVDDHFGAALAAGDFNGDGFTDVAMGVPGQTVAGATRAGAVSIVLGGLIRMDIAGNRFLHQDSGGVIGRAGAADEFGRVLAAGDVNGDGLADLVIGIPGERVGGKVNAGAVTVLPGSGIGPTANGDAFFREGVNGLNGAPANQDGFGSSIAVGDVTGDGRDDLLIGIPNQRVAGNRQAGTAAFIPGSPGLGTIGDSRWHENTKRIVGVAQKADHLGAAVSIGDVDGDGFGDLVLGIPDQNRDGKKDIGAVLVIRGGGGGPVKAGDVRLWQGRDGIRDQGQPFDRFGAAL